MYTQQAALSAPSSAEEYSLYKRRIDAHSRASIPLFRGSNLGIFVRKRPFPLVPEHVIFRRKEIRSNTDNDNDLAEYLSNDDKFQRRFDDYSENPGPMFG